MELTDLEVELIDNMLDELFDDQVHYPTQYSDAEVRAQQSLRKKVRDEAKKRGFWWAR